MAKTKMDGIGYMHDQLKPADRVPMGPTLPKKGMAFTRGKSDVPDQPTLGPRTA